MKGFIIALQFLTRLPTPRLAVSDAEFAACMRWFPAVGLVVGALVTGGAWAGNHVDPWMGALAALVLWVGVTGSLHLDGLGDIADGLGAAHKNRDKLLAVLADPHAGSFAVVAIGLQLLAKLVLLHALVELEAFPALILVPFTARIGTLVWTRHLPPLHQGLAARFREAVRLVDVCAWTAALLLCAIALPALLVALPFFLLWGRYLKRKLGGISGDGHGAGIELCETLLLIAIVVAARLA